MNTTLLLIGLAVLIGALFLSDYATRPRSVRWYMKRFTRHTNRLNVVIGERLAPAFEDAALAMAGLAVLLEGIGPFEESE